MTKSTQWNMKERLLGTTLLLITIFMGFTAKMSYETKLLMSGHIEKFRVNELAHESFLDEFKKAECERDAMLLIINKNILNIAKIEAILPREEKYFKSKRDGTRTEF